MDRAPRQRDLWRADGDLAAIDARHDAGDRAVRGLDAPRVCRGEDLRAGGARVGEVRAGRRLLRAAAAAQRAVPAVAAALHVPRDRRGREAERLCATLQRGVRAIARALVGVNVTAPLDGVVALHEIVDATVAPFI